MPAARPLRSAAPAMLALVLVSAACDAGRGPDPELPGRDLLARAEAALLPHLPRLRRESLEHYALLHPVEEADLLRWTAPLAARPDGDAFVLAVGDTPELHGGAVLDFLFRHWRPGGRAARPDDAYPFRGAAVLLGALEAGHRLQVLLPVPGRPAEAIAGAIPDPPQLPRMRFFAHTPGVAPVERDAWGLLGLLVAREDDFARTWRNDVGQRLSVDLLLGHAWARYRDARATGLEGVDHSWLHLVEVLLAYCEAASRRGAPAPLDVDALKRRFLAVELARPLADVDDEAAAHYAESLGRLLADPHVRLDADERAHATEWLRELEDVRFRELARVEDVFLAHLLKGLDLIDANRARLDPPAAR